MTYDHWKTTNHYDEQAEDPVEQEPEPGALRLVITSRYPGRWTCVTDQYDGPGSMLGSGKTVEEAAADFCEQYADREVVAKLAEAWEAVNVLGGTEGGSYNDAIGQALAVLEGLGAPQGRKR